MLLSNGIVFRVHVPGSVKSFLKESLFYDRNDGHLRCKIVEHLCLGKRACLIFGKLKGDLQVGRSHCNRYCKMHWVVVEAQLVERALPTP